MRVRRGYPTMMQPCDGLPTPLDQSAGTGEAHPMPIYGSYSH
jgi:hypothetical protein